MTSLDASPLKLPIVNRTLAEEQLTYYTCASFPNGLAFSESRILL